MALPTDSNDAFIREVEENYRRDRLESFAKQYGLWIAAALVLFLGAVAGWIYWQGQQQQESARESEELHAAFGDIAADRLDPATKRLEGLTDASSDVTRASALLTRAAIALDANDRAAAIASYRQLANDEGMPQAYRDVAMIRASAIEFDSLKPEEVIARLEPLAKPGQPWFGSAGEMTALAYLRQGQNQKAGQLFAAIAADRQVPDTIRSRAVQIAGTLGVDASASLPGFDQQDANR